MTEQEIKTWLLTHAGVENEYNRNLIYNTLCTGNHLQVSDKVLYISAHLFKGESKTTRTAHHGYWDGEKGIFQGGKLIVRDKKWLIPINGTSQEQFYTKELQR